MTHPTTHDGPARQEQDPGPLFRDPMSEGDAVGILVAFVNASPPENETAQAARIILTTLKAQAEVGKRLEAIVHRWIKEAEEGKR